MTVLAVIAGIIVGGSTGAVAAQAFNKGPDDFGFGAFMCGCLGAIVGGALGAVAGAALTS